MSPEQAGSSDLWSSLPTQDRNFLKNQTRSAPPGLGSTLLNLISSWWRKRWLRWATSLLCFHFEFKCSDDCGFRQNRLILWVLPYAFFEQWGINWETQTHKNRASYCNWCTISDDKAAPSEPSLTPLSIWCDENKCAKSDFVRGACFSGAFILQSRIICVWAQR